MNDYYCKVNARFIQGLLQLFLLSLVKKIAKWASNLLQFFISYGEKFLKLIKFITQSYLSFLYSFLFLSKFSAFLKSVNDYFFRRLV